MSRGSPGNGGRCWRISGSVPARSGGTGRGGGGWHGSRITTSRATTAVLMQLPAPPGGTSKVCHKLMQCSINVNTRLIDTIVDPRNNIIILSKKSSGSIIHVLHAQRLVAGLPCHGTCNHLTGDHQWKSRKALVSGVAVGVLFFAPTGADCCGSGLAGACPRKACPARRRGGTPEEPRVTREGGGESTPQLGTLADEYRETSSSLSDNPARECARSIDDAPEEGSDSGASPPYHR